MHIWKKGRIKSPIKNKVVNLSISLLSLWKVCIGPKKLSTQLNDIHYYWHFSIHYPQRRLQDHLEKKFTLHIFTSITQIHSYHSRIDTTSITPVSNLPSSITSGNVRVRCLRSLNVNFKSSPNHRYLICACQIST